MRCQVELVGRLSESPDLRAYPNGDRLALLTVATEDSWQDRQTGERKVRTTWHTVRVSKRGVVKAVDRNLAKGDLVMIVGSLRYSEWVDDQQTRRRTAEIVVKAPDHHILFLSATKLEPPHSARSLASGWRLSISVRHRTSERPRLSFSSSSVMIRSPLILAAALISDGL